MNFVSYFFCIGHILKYLFYILSHSSLPPFVPEVVDDGVDAAVRHREPVETQVHRPAI